MKSFDCQSHTRAFMNALEEKLIQNPVVAKNPAHPTGYTGRIFGMKIKNVVEKKIDEVVHSLPSNSESSSIASEESSRTGSGSRHHSEKESRKTVSRRKGRTSRKTQSPFSTLTFSGSESKNTILKENSETMSSKLEHRRRHRPKHN